MLAEILAQIVLFSAGQLAHIALATLSDPVVEPVENGTLFFLHQKQDFQGLSLSLRFSSTQNNSCCRTALRKNSLSPKAGHRRAAR